VGRGLAPNPLVAMHGSKHSQSVLTKSTLPNSCSGNFDANASSRSRTQVNATCACTPGGIATTVAAEVRSIRQAASKLDSGAGMQFLDGGEFLMGSEDRTFPQDGESPIREQHVDPFFIDPVAVTNDQFANFVDTTGYETEAEISGWSFVFYDFLPPEFPPTRAVIGAQWWRQTFGASWSHPEGPHSGIADRLNHPVVHVSWNDAVAFATWAGKRLPCETEWEYAARGGLVQKLYPWGDELTPQNEHQCNIWQGTFPSNNTAADGHTGTAPVDAYSANGFGLYNMVGNVWEWCSDWFGTDTRKCSSERSTSTRTDDKIIRGGSYLCHESYCNRYRVSARHRNSPGSSSGHMGFRLALDPNNNDHDTG